MNCVGSHALRTKLPSPPLCFGERGEDGELGVDADEVMVAENIMYTGEVKAAGNVFDGPHYVATKC